MSNYSSLKASIDANIKTNGVQAITGAIANSVLNAMVDSLGAGYQYKGVATPSTNPGTPDYNVFYLASQAGTYTNFGSIVISDNEVAALVYNGTWSKQTTGAATASEVSQLAQKIDEFAQGKFYGYFGDASELPAGDISGFAYVGTQPPFAIYNYDGGTWTDSGLTVNDIPVGNGEDIDFNAGGLLQFANRAYDAQNPNGMGYVILRKNKTFAEQVTGTNTIYEIRDNFNLNGGSVNIPAGCILKFNGGVIGNGTIVGNGTSIDAAISKIFDSTISISGTWDVDHAFVEWFGAVGDGVSDDLSFVQNCFSSPFKRIRFIKSYYISNSINITSDKVVDGGGTLISPSSSSKRALLHFSNCQNAIVDGLSFRSTRDNVSIPPAGHTRADGSVSSNIYFLYFTNVDNAEVYNCKYENSEIDILCGSCVSIFEDGFVSKNASCHLDSVDTNKVVSKNGNIALYNLLGRGDHSYYLQTNLKDALIENCKMIDESGLTEYQVHIYGGSGETLAQNVVVKDCYIKCSSMVVAECKSMEVSNTLMEFVASSLSLVVSVTYQTDNTIVFRNCRIENPTGTNAGISGSPLSYLFDNCDFNSRIEIQSTATKTEFSSCIFRKYFLRNKTTKDSYKNCHWLSTLTFNVASDSEFDGCVFHDRITASGACVAVFNNCTFSAESGYLVYTTASASFSFNGCNFTSDNSDGLFSFRNDSAAITFNSCTGENKNASQYLEYNSSNRPSVIFFDCFFPNTQYRSTSNPNYTFKDSVFLNNYVGQIKYDPTLGKCVVWNGTAWINVDGSALS